MKVIITAEQISKFRPSGWTRVLGFADTMILVFGAYQFWSGEWLIAIIALLASMILYWQELKCIAIDFAKYMNEISDRGELITEKDSES